MTKAVPKGAAFLSMSPVALQTLKALRVYPQRVSEYNVRDLYENHMGDVLIGASSGLYRINTASGTKKLITKIDDKFTGYVCEDNAANILIASDGKSRFDGKNYEVIVKEVSNLGIFGAKEDAQGTIWYGSMDGLHSMMDGKDVSYKKPQ